MRIQLSAKIIRPRLRGPPLTIKRRNLIQQGKRLRIAAPRKRGAHLRIPLTNTASIENL